MSNVKDRDRERRTITLEYEARISPPTTHASPRLRKAPAGAIACKDRASRAIIAHYSSDERSIGELRTAFAKAVLALEAIANCNETDLVRYVKKVDEIAVETLINLEIQEE